MFSGNKTPHNYILQPASNNYYEKAVKGCWHKKKSRKKSKTAKE